ncbi:adenylate and guanylate cyclase catalytic domain-containing protein [Ditylenchus destructor]|nr:adenylate and guanylate cyclase catalytic domain-containing protein [Ditylenchus destructor]
MFFSRLTQPPTLPTAGCQGIWRGRFLSSLPMVGPIFPSGELFCSYKIRAFRALQFFNEDPASLFDPITAADTSRIHTTYTSRRRRFRCLNKTNLLNYLFSLSFTAYFYFIFQKSVLLVDSAPTVINVGVVLDTAFAQSATQLLLKANDKLMSTMSATNIASNVAAVLSLLSWQKVAFITCSSCFEDYKSDEGTFKTIKRVLAAQNVEVLVSIDVGVGQTSPDQLATLLQPIHSQARIIIALFGNTVASYKNFLQALEMNGMNNKEYVPIIIVGTYTSRELDRPWIVVGNSPTNGDPDVSQLYEQAIVVSNNYYNATAIERFSQEMGLQDMEISKLMTYVQLYESYWLYAFSLERAFERNSTPQIYASGEYLRHLMQTELIQGPFGNVPMDSNSQRLAPYKVFMLDTKAGSLVEVIDISLSFKCSDGATTNAKCALLIGNHIAENQSRVSSMPPDIPSCGFSGELCDQRGTIIIVVTIMVTICLAFIVFLCFGRVKTGENSQMPWAIPSATISFVELDYTGSSNMSIHSIQQQIESQNAIKDLLRSRQLATIEQGFVIVEPYRLKERLTFDKRDMQLLFQMKQSVHDNINPFIGMCIDKSNEFYVIWRHCFRGTLADLLFSNKSADKHDDRPTVVDNNFKGAFVRDIIKGIDFLHTSNIGYHGGLTTSQCLVDSHWILKISGFGITRLLFKWRHNGMLADKGPNGRTGLPLVPNSELHYYAPEVRRAIKLAVQRNKPEDFEFSNEDGQAADMYSFGSILYEILFKKRVVDIDDFIDVTETTEDDIGIFSLQAEEKIPLYPTFPDEEIHPDLISLMHKCFNGKVDQRPDANMVRKITDATLKMPGSLVDQMIKNMEQYTNNLEALVREQTGKLEEEQQHAEQILLELLPKSVVDELRLGRRVEPKFYKSVTIMYSDIVGFTSLCSESQPMEVVNLLNGMFKAFDHAISQHKAYKVETIGDAYMVASGVPEKLKTEHVREIASIALMQREFLNEYEIPHKPAHLFPNASQLHCRWGFNSGSVFTGVVGITAPRYCVFGTTVTLAAKMENSGQPDKIQMTLKSYQLLSEQFPEFRCRPRGGVRLEGIGTLLTYWLDGRDEISLSDPESFDPDASNSVAEQERPYL